MNISNATTLGERIKIARLSANLEQKELGEIIGMTQSAVSHLERGSSKKTFKVVEIAIACEVNPFWLATGKGDIK